MRNKRKPKEKPAYTVADAEAAKRVQVQFVNAVEIERGTPIIPRRPNNRPPDGVRLAVSW